jgi:addiction module RelB/DinJ family antitoxin
MTEQVRYRIDRELLREAEQVCHEIGLTPAQVISAFLAQLVKVRGLPFRPSEFPVLEEYGATLADATAAEDAALKDIKAQRKAGKVVRFTGRLG